MKTVLIVCAILAIAFTVSMVIVFCKYGAVPDTLIVSVFGAIFGEYSLCGIIKNAKLKREGNDKGNLESEDIN